MIFKGETSNAKREVIFQMISSSTGVGITGINWNTMPATSLKVCAPGGSIGNADLTRIVEKGEGNYALQLDDAQVANAGSGIVSVDPSNSIAVAATWSFDVVDPADFRIQATSSGSGGSQLPAGTVTLSGLISEVRTRGDYLSSITFTDAWITTEIQAAWAELYELIAETHEGWWDTKTTLSTVANQDFVALPSDCWRVQGIDVLDSGVYRPLRQIGLTDRNRYTQTPGLPYAFRLSARGAELFPIPNSVYTLRIQYTPVVTTMDNTGIQLYGWEEYIIVSALLRLDQREERPLGERMAELERQKQRIIVAASKRRSAEPEYLPLREQFDAWPWGDW
jgi:hypothetical protein